MCYYVHDRIHDDVDFIRRMTSTFLIRNPERTIPSYFRLDPGVTLEEIGCEAQYRLFERVGGITGRTPIVIDAADLAEDPTGTLRALLPGAGGAVHTAGAGVGRGFAGHVAGRERLARRSGRLHGYHRRTSAPGRRLRRPPGWTPRPTFATTTNTTSPSTGRCGRIGSNRPRADPDRLEPDTRRGATSPSSPPR